MLYVKQPERFEALRLNVNRALVFAGLSIDATGTLSELARATTVSEARRRAQELRTDLTTRGRFGRSSLFRHRSGAGDQFVKDQKRAR